MKKVFIDGSAGTTGLKIYSRLQERRDIELLTLSDEMRKDPLARKDMLNTADVSFLCLPDAAAIEAVALMENEDAALIDTSTAHRVNEDWVYGFAELTGQRQKIMAARRVANPGCHASGFIALVAPLVEAGLIRRDALLSAFSLTGYSGGGKKMIAQYEDEARCPLLDGPRQYALTQAHKHLPEMSKVCGLEHKPVFSPIVADYFAGMEVTVPLHREMLAGTPEQVKEVYRSYYRQGLIRYADETEEGFLSAASHAGKDSMQVSVYGNEERILLVSRFDNLGKGASGAAIQNMNLLLGVDETTSLVL